LIAKVVRAASAWEEPDGLVVQVSGLGLDRGEITAVAESVAEDA
jgi:hypothetical protein